MYMDKISRSFDFNFRRYRALGRYLLIQSKGIKAHIARVVAIGSLAIATNAQPSVSWQTPVSISGTSDVKTSGVYFGSPNTPDGNYNTLLESGVFSNEGFSPASFRWGGMAPGHTYRVQIWVNDGRNIGESRSETVTGGANTSAPLSYGSEPTGQACGR